MRKLKHSAMTLLDCFMKMPSDLKIVSDIVGQDLSN